jgi:hypothetical protein
MIHRARLALPLAALALFLLSAGSAQAKTYCVDTANCAPADTYALNEGGLNGAIAAASVTVAEDDRIEIGVGTINLTAPITYTSSSGNEIYIEGAGSGLSIITSSIASGDVLTINATGASGETLSNLGFKLLGAPAITRRMINQLGGRATGISVENNGGPLAGSVGARFANGAECWSCSFMASGDNVVGVYADTGATFKNLSIDVAPAAQTVGLMATSGTTLIQSAVIRGAMLGATTDSGKLDIRDTLIDLGPNAGARGVLIANSNGGSTVIEGGVNGATIVGTGDNQTGFRMSEMATQEVTTWIRNSLIKLTGSGVLGAACNHAGSSTTILDIEYVMLNGGAPSKNAGCTGNTGTTWDANDHALADLFLDAAGGDYRVKPGAVVIDQGNQFENSANHTSDAAGNARIVDGNLDGTPIIDVGAYEYQNYAPNKPQITVTPTSVDTATPIHFSATATDDNGDTLSYFWSFNDGTSADTAAGDHIFAQPGSYSIAVWANDGQSSSDAATATVTVTQAPVVPAPELTLTLGKQTGKASLKKMMGAPKIGEATSRAKGQVPITSSAAVDVRIKLLRVKAGYVVGSSCKSKPRSRRNKKRCDLAIGKTRSFKIPAGKSQFTLGKKWGSSKLVVGRYRIVVSSSRLKDARRATLNVIR